MDGRGCAKIRLDWKGEGARIKGWSGEEEGSTGWERERQRQLFHFIRLVQLHNLKRRKH